MSAGDGDILGELAGVSPRRMLEDLARLGATFATSGRSRPEIELYVASGHLIRGRIVAVADDRQGGVVLVQTGESLESPSVVYVRVDQIAAATVIDASLLVRSPAAE